MGSFIIVSVITPVEKRPLLNGILSSLYAIAGVFSPLLGGVLTDYASWRWCFYINLSLGSGTEFSILLLFQAQKPTKSPASAVKQLLELDIIGLALFIPGFISLLLVLQWGGAEYPWTNWRIIVLLPVFRALMLAFAAVKYWQQDRAMIPPGLIASRDVWGPVMFAFCLTGSVVIFSYYISLSSIYEYQPQYIK